ncbi:MAG: HAMP domain-containing histidine kinase [Pirellulales bacterium]|nr:HAMP domain-containing histidine kinase [Pirellulales bacterium]
MSYKSFKKVLGETHLERKLLVLFGICVIGLMAISFWLYGTQTEKLLYQQNRQKAELLAGMRLLQIHWEKWGDISGNAKPDVLAEDIAATLQNTDYKWSRILPQPRGELGRPVTNLDFEAKDLFPQFLPQDDLTTGAEGDLTGGVDWWEAFDPDDDEFPYVYYQAIYAKDENCTDCHNLMNGPFGTPGQPTLEQGELLGIMRISLSDAPVKADIAWNNAMLWATAILTAFLLVVACYFIIRYTIVKPLAHLQEVSEAISHGNFEQRADITTGDEFEQVADSFNRMVRHLITVQEELRRVNQEMDGKLDQLAQKNMELFEMNRLKGDFLATMSHELRTPLNSIIGFSDVLASLDNLDKKQLRYVGNIKRSGKLLLELINDVLDLAKIESGKMEIRLSDFRIDQVINAQLEMARPLVEKKNIDLAVEIQPGLVELHQDQRKVQQILNNLLSNAIKFTPEGGRIEVRARCSARGDLLLSVTDTGVGISQEDQKSIFEKFRQGASHEARRDATTREFSGTGLGLSIVKELCRLLAGEITLESELGQGSSFTVRLPWTLPDHAARDQGLPTPSLEALLSPRRVSSET